MNTWMIAAGLETDCLKNIKAQMSSGSYERSNVEWGEKRISRRLTDHDKDVIIKLHLEGKSNIDICFETSVSANTVWRIVRAYNAKIRERPKGKKSPVKVISYNGIPDGRTFQSLTEASDATGVNRRSISDVASGLAKTSKGYVFEWLN